MRKNNLGFSLIELMISMAIGLVLVAAMITLYVSQQNSYRQLEALSRMQENARYAFEIMGHDIRMAGNWTCYVPGQTAPSNFLNTPTSAWWRDTGRPLFGVEEGGTFPSDYSANVLRGDTVLVLRADHDATPGIVGGTYDLGTADISVANATYLQGTLLILTDCKIQTAVFQKSGPSGAASGTIEHAAGASPTPGNSAADLLGALSPTSVVGARVMPLLAQAYYLRNSPRKYSNSAANIPSLYRQALTTSGGNASTTAEELVDGVIDMQVVYGEDTSSPVDRAIDVYRAASSVANWANVLAVRVTLTMQSTENNIASSNQTFTYGNGATVSDRRLRRQYSATFGIRGRLQ
jgi:type IV pilus assembly protein PilW